MTASRITLDPKIRFIISVPDWQPEEATPFQGFAYSLCQNSGLLRFIQQMPTDIFELTPEFYLIELLVVLQARLQSIGTVNHLEQ